MMDDKVIVTSMVSGQVGITMPELRFSKTWPKKGSKLPVSKDFLREAIFDPGVEYMFKNGILSIDDMDFKIEIGLEEEGTEEPTQVLNIDEKFMNRVLRLMPVQEMKQTLQKMKAPQIQEFLDYTADQKDVNLSRLAIIDEYCHTDMLKVIELKRQREE